MSAGERSTQPDMLTDENPNPVLSASRDGQVVYRNQAARGVLAGQGYTVTVPDEWLPVLGKAFESGGVVEVEWHAGVRTYACKFVPADDGERADIYCTDITRTSRRRAPCAERSPLPYGRRGSVEGVILQDRAGVIRASNASAERILGLTLDQMMARVPIDPRWRTIRETARPHRAIRS